MPSSRCRRVRSSSYRSPTRAMRSTLPTRAGGRSTTRCTAPTSRPRRAVPKRGSGYNRCAAPGSSNTRATCSTARCRSRGSHVDSVAYRVIDNQLAVTLAGGATTGLKNPAQFVGFQGEMDTPSSVLLSHHGLHLDIRVDPQHPIGAADPAGVCDLVLEAALSTIPRPRGLGRRGRRGGQGAGVRQLARDHAGHADRGGRKGRPDLHPWPEPGPPLHRTARRGRRDARPLAALHPQRRPPDDEPGVLWGDDGREIPGASSTPSSRRRSRCTTCGARATASATAARDRSTSSSPRCTARPRVAFAAELFGRVEKLLGLPTARSSSASWTRSGAPASTSRPASLPRRAGSRSSTPASSTAPATRCTPRCTPGR